MTDVYIWILIRYVLNNNDLIIGTSLIVTNGYHLNMATGW